MTAAPDERAPLPPALAEIAEDFSVATARERLELLLEFSDGLPDLPERYADAPEQLERVDECQSPVFLVVEVAEATEAAEATDVAEGAEGGSALDRRVSLFFSAPPEAPTTRGFAGILHEGLDGLTAGEVLAVPDDAPYRFGLAEAVSPLRLRGMVGMLGRIKRQVRLRAGIA